MTFGVKFSASEVDDAFAEMNRRGHDRRRPPEGPDGVKVNISQVFSHQSIANRIIRKPHKEESPPHDPATGFTLSLCGDSHSFCEKSKSPSSIRDSPLGSMKIY